MLLSGGTLFFVYANGMRNVPFTSPPEMEATRQIRFQLSRSNEPTAKRLILSIVDRAQRRAHNRFRFPSEPWAPTKAKQQRASLNLFRRCVMSSKPTFAAFNQGQIPTIACFNQATIALGVDFDALIAAMQAYVVNTVAPVWGTPANLVKTTDFQPGAWAMVFLDNAHQAGALSYHHLTPRGFPQANVFVKTTLANNDLVSVSASHELGEMLVDPAINMMTTGPARTTIYPYHSATHTNALTSPV